MTIKFGTGKWYEWPLGGFFSGKDAETNPYGSLNPDQVRLSQSLGPYLQAQLGGKGDTYTGDYSAPLTSGEQDAISRNSRMSALGEQGLSPLLRGEFPEDYYQSSIYKPLLKQYTEDIQPLIEEQYAGNGYWGSARAGAVGKGYGNLYDTLVSKRAELGWEAQKNIPTAVNAANALSTTEAAMQSTPRLVQNYNLKSQFDEWVRNLNYKQNSINQALNFLDLSTGTYTPAEPSMFEQLLPESIKMAAQAGAGAAGARV